MTRVVLGALVGLAGAVGLLLALAALTRPRSGRPRRARSTNRARGGLTALCVAAGLLGAITTLVLTAVPVAALIAGVTGAVAPLLWARRQAAREARVQRAAWPDAVDDLLSGVRAGLALPEAVAALAERGPAPLRPAFTSFAVEYRSGGSFTTALDVLEVRLADPVADRVVAALRLAREFGGSELSVILRTLSAMLREEARTRSEIEGRQSWTIAAARMAVAAPWVTLALLCTRPDSVRAYASPVGGAVLASAAVATALAYALMIRIGRLPMDERVPR